MPIILHSSNLCNTPSDYSEKFIFDFLDAVFCFDGMALFLGDEMRSEVFVGSEIGSGDGFVGGRIGGGACAVILDLDTPGILKLVGNLHRWENVEIDRSRSPLFDLNT